MPRPVIFGYLCLLSVYASAQDYPRGILPGEDAAYSNIPQKAPLTRSFYSGAPPAFSLKPYAPAPGNQDRFGTCTGWAVAYAARTIVEAKKKGWANKYTITENAFSPTYQYRQAASDVYNCDGAYTSEVVETLKTAGSVPLRDFRIDSGSALCPVPPFHQSNHDIAAQHKIDEYATLWANQQGYDYDKVGKIKTSLSEGNPVVISMICPRSFNKVDKSGLWSPAERPEDVSPWQHGSHAMCVVGYDDTKFGGAFEIQNSWGTDWGDEGYAWVKYDDFAGFVYQAYEIVQFPPPLPETPYLAGSLRLYDMDDKRDLPVQLAGKTRNWNVVGPAPDAQPTYQVTPNLRSGSEMRMYLKSEQPAYVYLLGTGDVDKSVLTLFPVDGISPAMNYTGYEVALPSEDHYFKMDDTTGKNYIIVLFSKEKLDIAGIRNKVASGGGSLTQKLHHAVGDLMIDSKYITFSPDEIKFEVAQPSGGRSAFAMVIAFNQVSR